MSKFKKILKIASLGLLSLTNPNQTSAQETITPHSQTQVQTPSSETLRPQQRPTTIIDGTFEEFLAYFRFIDQTRNIQPMQIEHILELRRIIDGINAKPQTSRTQPERDLLMFYNRFRHQVDRPLILQRTSEILGAENPTVTYRGNLDILQGRIRNAAFNVGRPEQSLQPLIFYPNEVDPSLNSFLLENLDDPQQISNGAITSIHPSYYRFLVGLLLIENNFGNTTTSNANAQGSFQIKPEAQEFTRRGFNLSSRQQQDLEVLGFLHLFQIARLFGIDISRKPTYEEIILLSWSYFRGINSYRQLYIPSNDTLDKIRNYSYIILFIMQREDLFIINQNNRNPTRS